MTWKRWALLAAGTLLIVVLAVVGVGAALPVSHTATDAVTVAASPAQVWSLITDIDRFPEWRTGVDSVERLPDRDGRTAWREHGSDGALTFAVAAADPPRRLVTRIADRGLPFGGAWTYRIEPLAGGTRLEITEAGEVYNPVFRFVSRFVIGHDATIRRYLADVEAARTGETD